ncbi:MAG TPA: heterodisulfide reductase subunit C [Myxococcales bacterium]|jgi:heterodisulfide reductase subunit C|nr:heterodisulfide reductase subunit C [Myxococcales bacterium]
MAEEMSLKPHQMLRLAQVDSRERLFEDDSIWLCLTCETCTARCPNGVDPARIIDCLRELALRAKASPPRRIAAFHRSFLEQIRENGRVFEFGLVANYKMRTGDLFADVTAAPGMLVRGKLALLPKGIEGIGEVRRIFATCAQAARKEGR